MDIMDLMNDTSKSDLERISLALGLEEPYHIDCILWAVHSLKKRPDNNASIAEDAMSALRVISTRLGIPKLADGPCKGEENICVSTMLAAIDKLRHGSKRDSIVGQA